MPEARSAALVAVGRDRRAAARGPGYPQARPDPARMLLGLRGWLEGIRSDEMIATLCQSGLGLLERDYYLRRDNEFSSLRSPISNYNPLQSFS